MTVDTPGIEALKLYPSTPLSDFPAIHHVIITRPTDPTHDNKNPDLLPRLEFNAGKEKGQIHYYPDRIAILEQHGDTPSNRHLSSTRTRELLTFIDSLKERPPQLYRLQLNAHNEWSWMSRYRLINPQPRDIVLGGIHAAVQALRDHPSIREIDVPKKGLSGALIGPNDAELVEEVIFASDPSNKYGLRESADMDFHAFAIAKRYGWEETDEAVTSFDDWIRTIMGRNTDLYGGTSAFSLEKTRSLLPDDTMLNIEGGLLFSSRPTWDNPYSEPAAIVKATIDPNDPRTKADALYEMSELAWMLGRQDRWVAESDKGADVYKSNA